VEIRSRRATEAITFVKDALASGPLRILPEQTFVPHSAALVNDANEGIAHIVMPHSKESRPIRNAAARPAEHVAEEIGIAPHAYFREAAE
jgi:hypothetical protein